MTSSHRRIRSTLALALLGVMWLGSACHFWHHLTDPSCGAATARGAQPCATCSAFHGGTIVSDPQTSALSVPVSFAAITLPDADRPSVVRVSGGSPRAPPTA
jgi:hypothetical protein